MSDEQQPDQGESTSRYPAGSPPPSTPPPSMPPPASPPPASPPPASPPPASGRGPSVSPLHVLRWAVPVLILLGTLIPFDYSMLFQNAVAWSAFAVVAAIVQATPVAALGVDRSRQWTVAAAGTGALVLFWVLIALPGVASTAGFVLTIGTAAAVAALALSPDRRW